MRYTIYALLILSAWVAVVAWLSEKMPGHYGV